jgi:hypothetical protein
LPPTNRSLKVLNRHYNSHHICHFFFKEAHMPNMLTCLTRPCVPHMLPHVASLPRRWILTTLETTPPNMDHSACITPTLMPTTLSNPSTCAHHAAVPYVNVHNPAAAASKQDQHSLSKGWGPPRLCLFIICICTSVHSDSHYSSCRSHYKTNTA